jgi:hypothetical protein
VSIDVRRDAVALALRPARSRVAAFLAGLAERPDDVDLVADLDRVTAAFFFDGVLAVLFEADFFLVTFFLVPLLVVDDFPALDTFFLLVFFLLELFLAVFFAAFFAVFFAAFFATFLATFLAGFFFDDDFFLETLFFLLAFLGAARATRLREWLVAFFETFFLAAAFFFGMR